MLDNNNEISFEEINNIAYASEELVAKNLLKYLEPEYNKRVKNIDDRANEIVNSLGTGVCDIAITGIDLWKESEPSIQSKIRMVKKYDFAKAELSVCVPQIWLDCVNTADLEEISYEFYNKKND